MATQYRLFGILILLALSVSAGATSDSDNRELTASPKPEKMATDDPVVSTLEMVTVSQLNDESKTKTEPKMGQGKKSATATKRIEEVRKVMKGKTGQQKTYEKKQRGKDPNAFYRYKTEQAVKQRLIDDGVHDPTADLSALQPPLDALKGLPPSTFGNGINWVEALRRHKIEPRADQLGKKKQFTLEMNIHMDVTGTMNDVVFPHRIHTEWLACKNCHTKIFKMKKDGNPITMQKITAGKYCGVCHGKVAFPIANCNRCHSAKKKKTSLGKKK